MQLVTSGALMMLSKRSPQAINLSLMKVHLQFWLYYSLHTLREKSLRRTFNKSLGSRFSSIVQAFSFARNVNFLKLIICVLSV
jgi:hypothetical protein